MTNNRTVCQEGKVISIKDRQVQVKILSQSACAQCHARGFCTSLDMADKIIDAIAADGESLEIGDNVVLTMEEKLGWRAVLYGFVLPLIVLTTFFFVSYALGSKETAAALLGIGSLVPYYGLLYAFRKKIEKDFIFKVEKK